MIPNKRDLKAYVRYDGQGKIVPSSVILARKTPKVGKWVEIDAYECCLPTTTALPIPAVICVYGFVENAGFNGTYTYVDLSGGRAHYEKDGELYDIYWDVDRWWIGQVAYSVDDVNDPTLVTLWVTLPVDGDIVVTEGECLPD